MYFSQLRVKGDVVLARQVQQLSPWLLASNYDALPTPLLLLKKTARFRKTLFWLKHTLSQH